MFNLDEIEFENVACDHCGSSEQEILFSGPDRLHHLPGTFQVVRCLNCGWMRQNPRPTPISLQHYYPTSYENFAIAPQEEPSLWRRLSRQYGLFKRRRVVERSSKKGAILDVGCATGSFLAEMRKHGWQVYGIEPNAYAASYAQHKLSIEVHQGFLRNSNFPEGSFDAITFWDVFEHLQSPWQDVHHAYRLLKVGGILILRVPNLDGIEARIFKELWIGWDLPRHLYFVHPRQLMDNLRDELGFRILASHAISNAYPFFLLNLRFYIEAKGLTSNWLLHVLKSPPFKLLNAPLFYVLSRLNLATTTTIVARKLK